MIRSLSESVMRSVNVSPMHDGPLDHTFVWVFWSRVNIYVECVILHAISSCLLPSSTVFHQNYFFYVLLLLKIVPLQYSWRHFCCHSRSLNPFQIPWRKKEFLLCFPHPHPKLSLLHWNTHRGNESFIRTGDSSDRL